MVGEVSQAEERENWDFGSVSEGERFDSEKLFASTDLKHLESPELEVKDLEELPEQWRRSKLAWLCKELPAHKSGTVVRLLNAQRKWMRQEDATYMAVHCMRIRENEVGFKVNFLPSSSSFFFSQFGFLVRLYMELDVP